MRLEDGVGYNESAVFEGMLSRPATKEFKQEPFAFPPPWIHASLAASCLLGKESPLSISRRREAKRRALLQMLDRIPIRSDRAAPVRKPAPAAPEIPLPPHGSADAAAPRVQK